ncbi:MAG: FAD/NAD(P)-binding protein [Gammaproteobacteria bacterium]|nr:FAD/NAD(P)-binding protein [Gammaproteobacteria bacterium]
MNPPAIFTVLDRREEIPHTVTLRIQPAQGGTVTPFAPGQFNMLYGFGSGEVPISFSGATAEQGYYSHTLRAVGKSTEALARLQPGDQLGVRGPFGRGWPMDQLAGRHVLIIAGGLGLAPLQPLIEAIVAKPADYLGAQLFYGGRRPEELLYLARMAAWRDALNVELTVDMASRDWSGHVGVVTGPLASAKFPASNTVAVVCGPEIMMRFAVRTLQQRGLDDASIYLSMERNMHCALGHCGRCQWGPNFVCKDGPVFRYSDIAPWFHVREL